MRNIWLRKVKNILAPQIRSSSKKKIKPGKLIKSKFRKYIYEYYSFRSDEQVFAKKEGLLEILAFAKKDSELLLNHLRFVTAVDNYPQKPRFEVVYGLYSISRKHSLIVKVKLEEDEAVPSIVELWPGANWHEREAYDLFGIEFENHPQLERLMMPDDWEGHPYRKDYPIFEEDE